MQELRLIHTYKKCELKGYLFKEKKMVYLNCFTFPNEDVEYDFILEI
jgi:hypothetical protein